jgi:hypothetical protein
MTSTRFCFDFDAPVAVAVKLRSSRAVKSAAVDRNAESARFKASWLAQDSAARAYWRTGMVTSLPLMCDIERIGRRYTQMLPGVIEVIDGDLAKVRIYAAPEYGYRLENYPLHMTAAVNVPLRDLGRHHGNTNLQRLINEGLLATGDAALAAEVRVRNAGLMRTHERELAGSEA